MGYKESVTLKAKGLHTYADQLESVPAGSLQVASNVVLDKTDLISPRRGYESLPGAIVGDIGSLHTFTDADNENTLIAHRDDDTLARYDDSGESWIDYAGTFEVPASSEVIRSVESNKNFFFSTSKGVQKLDEPTATPIDAGAPEGLDILVAAGGENLNLSGVIPDTYSAGYRVVWGYKDTNDNLILGAPSNKFVYTNTGNGGTIDLTLRIAIPTPPVDATWFVQLYRTETIASAAVGDHMQLALERNPDGTDLSNGFILLEDLTPDELLGAELYTNATQEGIVNANYQPPQCVDMALFQNHMFYANTESKYTFSLALLANLVVDDTVTINSVVYTAKNAEDASNNEFAIGSAGTTAQQIEQCARSLVAIMNNNLSGNTDLWAVYDSGDDELPGKMRFFERDFGDAIDFPISASTTFPQQFSPDIDNGDVATNNKNPNRLYFSKLQEPEAVPLLNFFDVGPANDRILRILPLRSTLLIFTTRAIYKMTGTTTSTFQVSLLDNTAKLLAPESLVPLNNTATGLFDQGVVRVSSTSVQIISRPIEGDLLDIRGAAKDKLSDLAFGISYESDRKYLLALPTDDTDTSNQIFYVYNTITNSWTTYDLAKTAGIVRPSDDKLYLAETGQISRERKDFTATDYSEEAIAVTTTAVSVDKLTLTLADVSSTKVGYIYYESASRFSVVKSIDTLASTITVDDPLEWTTGTFEVRPFISTVITWNPIDAKSPGMLKQFAECALLVETPLQDATLSFSTPTSGGFEGVNIMDTAEGPWGLFPWGEVPWGGEPQKTRYRTYVPRSKQREGYITTRLTQNTVFNAFQISGIVYYFRTISHRLES